MFDLFRRRRERESAIGPGEVQAAQTPAASAEPVGQMDPMPQGPSALDLAGGNVDLGEILGMVGQAMRSGRAQVTMGTPQEMDLTASGAREQILAALRRHGVDAEPGSGRQIDPGDYAGLQQQIVDVLAQHGVEIPKAAGGERPAPGVEGDGKDEPSDG